MLVKEFGFEYGKIYGRDSGVKMENICGIFVWNLVWCF